MTEAKTILSDAQALLPQLQTYAKTATFSADESTAKTALDHLINAVDSLDDGRGETVADVQALSQFLTSPDGTHLIWKDTAAALKTQTERFLAELPQSEAEADSFLHYVEESYLQPQVTQHLPQAPFKPGEPFPTWEQDFAPGYAPAMETLSSVKSVDDLEETIHVFAEAWAKVENHNMWALILTSRNTSVETYSDAAAFMGAIGADQHSRATQAFYTGLRANTYYSQLPAKYNLWKQKIEGQKNLYPDSNTELQKTVSASTRTIGKTIGAAKIDISAIVSDSDVTGPFPIQNAAPYFNSSLPSETRKQIWETYLAGWKAVGDAAQIELSTIVSSRDTIARNAGFSNYVTYRNAEVGRTISIDDMKTMLGQVKKETAPICREISAWHAESLGVDWKNYAPWDAPNFARLATPEGQTPLTPVANMNEAEVVGGFEDAFTTMHPTLGAIYHNIVTSGQLDLLTRNNKGPGIFTASFYRDANAPEKGYSPYVFQQGNLKKMGARDLMANFGHEIGHAMQGALVLGANSDPGIHITQIVDQKDKGELTGIVAEELLSRHFNAIIPNAKDQKQAAWDYEIRKIRETALYGANTEFEIWMYENPNHTIDERKAKYVTLMQEYGLYSENWDDPELMNLLFTNAVQFTQQPFTNYSYLLGRLAAAQIGEDYDRALKKGKGQEYIAEHVIPTWQMGGDDSYEAIWASYGLNFDVHGKMVHRAAKQFQTEFDRLKPK